MRLLELFRFDMLTYPWVLVLLLFVAVLFLAEAFARAPGALMISTGETLARIPGHGRAVLRRLPPLLRALGLSALIVALAGPMHGFQVRTDRANVVDIMICLDVSGSMLQRDFVIGGQPRDRLFVAKEAVRTFIQSRKERASDRYGMDRLGLVLYAGYAWTKVPLTLDYAILERELDAIQIDTTDRSKDGTAIGSGTGLSIARLLESEAETKVIIMLTDGLNNRGELDPITAAQMAKEYDIRIYTIGAGTVNPRSMPGALFPQGGIGIDEDMMTQMAEMTGGRYFRATDHDSLVQAYEEIGRLEGTEMEVGSYYEYKPAFLPWLLMGALAVLGGMFLRRQWFEVIP